MKAYRFSVSHVRVGGHAARVLESHAEFCEEVSCEGVKVGDLKRLAVEDEFPSDVEVLDCEESIVARRWPRNSMTPNDCA